jgi:hypothetical protein
MDKSMWDRWAPASGILFVVSAVVAYGLCGNLPASDASASEITSYIGSHHGRMLTAAVLIGFGTLFFVWFLASLAAILRKSGEPRLASVAYGAGLVVAGIFMWFAVIFGALAFSIAATGDDGVTKAFYDLQWPLSVLITIPVASLVLATSVAGMRANVLPNWLVWAGTVAAIAFAVGSTTWSEGSGFWSPDGAYSMIIFFVFLGWTAVVSGLLVARRAEAEMPVVASQPM